MPKTVLIADESITIRSVAESLLRGESYKVFSAGDGNMALELAHAEMPDLALIGEKLPGTSGLEVCAAMKSDPALSSIPIIFMRTDRPGAGPKDVDAILTKPFSPQSLLEAVHRFLTGEQPPPPPGPLTDMTKHGLQDELIDQALGLDDLGPAPAQELNDPVSEHIGDSVDSGLEELGPSSEGSVDEMGGDSFESSTSEIEIPTDVDTSDDPLSEISIDDDPGNLSSSVPEQAAVPATAGEDSVVQDLKEALDSAFGGDDDVSSSSHDLSEITSSLKTISLGDNSPAPAKTSEVTGGPPEEEISLGGDDEEEDSPHDYDWFINEMGNLGDETAEATESPERREPGIEPLIPKDESTTLLVTPPQADQSDAQVPGDMSVSGKDIDETTHSSNRGHNEFITEFRKEIARLEGSVTPEELDDDQTQHSSTGAVSLDGIDSSRKSGMSDEVKEIGDRLIDKVTQQVARELAAKIDSKAIYSLIEDSLKKSRTEKPKS